MNSATGNYRGAATRYARKRLREAAWGPSDLGMSQDLNDLLGFDIEVARGRLVQWLIDNGIVTQQEHDNILRGWREEDEHEAPATWATAEQIADLHGSAHYFVPIEVSVRPEGCRDNPCRAAAVSFALYELSGYWKAHTSGALSLLKGVKAVKSKLDTIDPDLLRLAPGGEAGAVRVGDLAALILNEAGPSAEVRARRWLADIARRLEEAPALLNSLASELDIEHLPGQVETKPGRPANEWLRVVWQLLARGGFNHGEIAALIPDLAPGSIEQRAERVRQCVRKPEIRGVTPHLDTSATNKAST